MVKKQLTRSTKTTVAAKKSGAQKTSLDKKTRSRQPPRASPQKAKNSATSSATVIPDTRLTAGTTHSGAFPIVGIGASAGGLETLETFFKAMPVDAGIAFVVVVHLDPTHTSILPELLQKHTTMPVCQVEDGMRTAPDHVYVIPPNKQLTILRGTLLLMDMVSSRGVKLPIDAFLRSLARDQERHAVCIILSGTGTDGALGVKAIKGEAGMVMVQDEASAKYDGMPRSAIATGLVDYVLRPEKMPEQLVSYMRHATKRAAMVVTADGPIAKALQKICVILRSQVKHDFSLYKTNTLCRRIERRMSVHQIDDISHYVHFLQESDSEAHVLFKELLIGVTSFFRDAEAFETLTRFLPSLLKGKPHDYVVRVWVPACSTGEEAYSVAIMLHECMERLGHNFRVQIFGTDIDTNAIDVARTGLYPLSIISDVGSERISRYFTKEEDGHYRVMPLIREKLVFAPQDIIGNPPFTRLDLLCCRNLLIYLGMELQKKLRQMFHYCLKPHGLLFLGTSETISEAKDLFVLEDQKSKIYRRKPSSESAHSSAKLPDETGASFASPAVIESLRKAEVLSAMQLIETILQETAAPPCAIIDDASNILFNHGQIGAFLRLPSGQATLNIVDMARPGLKAALAAAIRKVTAFEQKTVQRDLPVERDGKTWLVTLTVRRIPEHLAMHNMMMVIFEKSADTTKQDGRTRTAAKRVPVPQSSVLEQQLLHTRETLQMTIEELETSNEELKSANEELQSTNEELQSTNEELETSKEELQSLNEESVTVNAELQVRINDLRTSHDDMKNLLDSTNIATVFLDKKLRVRRFTPAATNIIPLTSSDHGRPVQHFASTLVDIDLAEYSQQVLSDLRVREATVRSKDDRIFILRVRPYRTTANIVDGVVITLEEHIDGRDDPPKS